MPINVNESSKLNLITNSDKFKEVYKWLLEDMLFEFDFLWWKIGIWKCWFPITVIRRKK